MQQILIEERITWPIVNWGKTMIFSSRFPVLQIHVCKNCGDIFMYIKAVNLQKLRFVHYVLLIELL